ncbi:cAMP-dependent protein kinase catalytic subunit alpha-like isoform X1 [Harmonia axyridis]|uniref:cAMP-dependent protein kinase catalytic subunit alpha-like isoform X1 n=1 Tax=Harmonia axyridis TaxID=115357 RepID=UPI001E275C81|nr:cAMP-dependent protein kinase catalytic subunit alpha-like isoform X1 [Harmonia axyridis]
MDPNATHFVNFQALLIGSKRKFDERWKQPFVERGKLEDFKLIQTLGTGSFGRVMLVKAKKDDSPFALKMLEKAHVVKTKQVKHTISEIRTMDSFDFPFLIKLEYFFKDNVYLCLVMPFVNGGEMFSHLRQQKRFSEELTRFYAAQVILAFEYIHFLGIIYRDLKPENILIDCIGYLKITDYGFCKKVDDQRTYTLCGTPEYLAPEIILSQGYNKSVDWWALGVLIFEMAAGYPPFYARDPMKIYEKIVSGKYIPANHFSKSLKDIIQNFLQVDRTKRFGILKGGAMDIKQHVFFKEIIWDTVYYKTMTPPYAVDVPEKDDVRYFEQYTEIPVKKSSKNLFAAEFAVISDRFVRVHW